jgi:hypothetical protein
MQKTLLSLCDYSGVWSEPFHLAGWRVTRVDLAHPRGLCYCSDGSVRIGADVRDLQELWGPAVMEPYNAVLAAPPCTCFCRPSARWWKTQDTDGSTMGDIATLRACLALCKTATDWWALENPPGRHQKLIPELGPPDWQWQPFHYGDPWHKQTYIWGTARKPEPTNIVMPPPTRRTPNGRSQGRIAFMSSSWKREREKTPAGFAQAFFEANSKPSPTKSLSQNPGAPTNE